MTGPPSSFPTTLWRSLQVAEAAVEGMRVKKWGRVVAIGSSGVIQPIANLAVSNTIRGAMAGFCKTLAAEVAGDGITVNMIAPGWIPVERHEKDPQEAKDAYLAAIPTGRWGRPEDVAWAVRYFASEQAAFVTGQTLCVNGGNSPW